MKNFLNALLSAIAIVLLIPTTLILISWNTLPGDSLYGLKRGLESFALFLTGNTPVAEAFSISFTDRRFSEANRLLAKSGSTVGYTLLVQNAEASKQLITQKQDPQKAQELIAKISEYQVQIQEKQAALALPQQTITPPLASTSPTPAPVAVPMITPVPTPTTTTVQTPIAVSNIVPVPAATTAVVISDLKETNDHLEKIKDDLKKELPPQASEKAQQNHPNGEESRNKNH